MRAIDIGNKHSIEPPRSNIQDRRVMISSLLFGGGSLVSSWIVRPSAWALAVDGAPSPATKYGGFSFPSIEYLEPMYELKISVENIVREASNVSKYPRLRRRLQDFFKPTSFQPDSEVGTYTRISRDYVNRITFPSNMSTDEIQRDREAREGFMEEALHGLLELRNALEADGDPQRVETCARKALQALDQWFALIPSQDSQVVDALICQVRASDRDRDGKLNALEVRNLTDEQQRQVWEKRVAMFGSSKVERCLGFKLTETSSY